MKALEKIDVAALRKADRLAIGLNPDGTMVCRAVKENRKTDSNPYAQDVMVDIPSTVVLHHNWRMDHTHATCAANFSFYRCGSPTAEQTAIDSVKVGDFIEFEFYADSHTIGYMTDAGLHADSLRLHINRGGKLAATYLLDVHCSSDTWGRMVRGLRLKEEAAA